MGGGDDVVLDDPPQRVPAGGHHVLLVRVRDQEGLRPAQGLLGAVEVHLVPVEVRVVGVAVRVVHTDGLVLAEDLRPVGHDPRLVQGRLPVHQQRVPVPQVPVHDHRHGRIHGRRPPRLQALRQAVPGGGVHELELDHLPVGVLDHLRPGEGFAAGHELLKVLDIVDGDVLGVRQRGGHEPRNANLVGRQVRVRRNHRASRKIHSLPHHLHPKQALLLLQHLTDPLRRSLPVNVLRRLLAVQEKVHLQLQLGEDLRLSALGSVREPLRSGRLVR
mmetsp:Transcript_26653/g.68861  ORF Transcript_26653/g.68861 Transcript_26653/m.68861 type:complete len:274 (-) Transcript_26653:1343-2164(-)